MIDTKTALYVKHDDGMSFSDYSHKAVVFERDSITFTLENATGYLYIGYHKPLNAVYFNCKTSGYTEGSLTIEYFNGTTWTELEASDDTSGFMRVGFLRWVKPQDQSENEIDSKSGYWLRLRPSVTRVDLEFKGINLVLADDYELSLEYPYINSTEFLGTHSSHILTHVAVRNEILQRLSNKDYYKINSEGKKENINAWDLHDLGDVRQAAVKLALSKIYRNMSDNQDDDWNSKSKDYYKEYEASISLARLSLDVNDDGLEQPSENKPQFQIRRISR